MAKHLTEKNVADVVDAIRAWPNNALKWEDICSITAPLVGRQVSRQTLQAHDEIKEAYKARKAGIAIRPPGKALPSSLAFAAQRIERLQAEIDELRGKNSKLLETFAVWQYNAYKRGLKEQDLYEPLPAIDRERTEEKVQHGPKRTGRRSG